MRNVVVIISYALRLLNILIDRLGAVEMSISVINVDHFRLLAFKKQAVTRN